MGSPRASITMGIPQRSADGKLYARYPLGDRPFHSGAGVTAAASAAQATASGGGSPDVWDATWEFAVARTDSEATVRSAFQSAGYADVINIQNGTSDLDGGWFYTVTEIPGYEGDFPEGAGRVLCAETAPRNLGGLWQADPSLVFWAGAGTPGNIPADVWIQFWQYNCRSGAQQSTFASRDKTLYVSNGSSEPGQVYPSTNFPWLALQGSAGFQHSDPPNDVDNFLALQAQRSEVPFDPGSDPAGAGKMFQNLSSTVIVPNQWWQARMHIDTSGAQGSAEIWLRPRGSSFTKVMEWLPGVTQFDPGGGVGLQTFQWPTSEDDRSGSRAMIWPSTTNGQGRHAYRYFGRLAIATSAALLPTGD